VRLTAEQVEEAFAGKGIGNKSIDELASAIGADPAEVRARLERVGMPVQPGEALKAAATRWSVTPLQLLKAALVDEP
jgi:hypothetical protein